VDSVLFGYEFNEKFMREGVGGFWFSARLDVADSLQYHSLKFVVVLQVLAVLWKILLQ